MYFPLGFCGMFIKVGAGLKSFGWLIIIFLNTVVGSKGESSICQLRYQIALSPNTFPFLQKKKQKLEGMLTVRI